MYSIGVLTTFIYTISLTFFLLGFYIRDFLWGGVGLGILFFAVATLILGIMIGKEIKRGISWKFW